MPIRLHFSKSKLEIKITRFKLLSYLRSLFNCVYFFLIYEILFENHILYEKVISVKIIIIIIIIFLFIIIIISLGYPLYSLLFGLYFQLGRYPVTRHASRMLPVDLPQVDCLSAECARGEWKRLTT